MCTGWFFISFGSNIVVVQLLITRTPTEVTSTHREQTYEREKMEEKPHASVPDTRLVVTDDRALRDGRDEAILGEGRPLADGLHADEPRHRASDRPRAGSSVSGAWVGGLFFRAAPKSRQLERERLPPKGPRALLLDFLDRRRRPRGVGGSPRGFGGGVSRARSAARAFCRAASMLSVRGCAPPNTRRAARSVSSNVVTASRRSSSVASSGVKSISA